MGSQKEIFIDYQQILDDVLSEKLPLQQAVEHVEQKYGSSVSSMFVVEVEELLRKKL